MSDNMQSADEILDDESLDAVDTEELEEVEEFDPFEGMSDEEQQTLLRLLDLAADNLHATQEMEVSDL